MAPRIRLLTGGDLRCEGVPADALPGPLPRALLVLLALAAGTPVLRETAAVTLWPETEQSLARQRLRMTALNLRRALGPDLAESVASNTLSLCLDIPPDNVDLLRFERLLGDGSSTRNEEALELYDGPLLAGFPIISDAFDEILARRREQADALAMSAVLATLQEKADAGDARGFTAIYQKGLKIDAASTELCLTAMAFFAARGWPERIEAAFRSHQRALEEVYDTAPTPALVSARDGHLAEARALRRKPRAEVSSPVKASGSAPPNGMSVKPAADATPRWRFGPRSGGLALVLAAISLIVGLGVAAWAVFRPRMPVTAFVLIPHDLTEEGCAITDVSNLYEAEVLDALRRLKRGAIVVAGAEDVEPAGAGEVMLLQSDIVCSGHGLVATVTLVDGTDFSTRWIERYPMAEDELGAFAERLAHDLDRRAP